MTLQRIGDGSARALVSRGCNHEHYLVPHIFIYITIVMYILIPIFQGALERALIFYVLIQQITIPTQR